jgi:hypothetical protein
MSPHGRPTGEYLRSAGLREAQCLVHDERREAQCLVHDERREAPGVHT